MRLVCSWVLTMLRRRETYLLFAFVLASWSLAVLLAVFYLPWSKYTHLEAFESYLKRVHQLEHSSHRATQTLRSWAAARSSPQGVAPSLVKDALNSRPKMANDNNSNNNNNKTFMCLALMSKRRVNADVNYINQAVASILTRTRAYAWRNMSLVAFDTEKTPDTNVQLAELADLVDIVHVQSPRVYHSNNRVQEALDYVWILRYLAAQQCHYSIIFEDDALVANGWYERVVDALNLLEHQVGSSDSWLCVKLFTGYTFFDWRWIRVRTAIIYVLLKALLLFTLNYVVLYAICNHRFCLATAASSSHTYLYHKKAQVTSKHLTSTTSFLLFVHSLGMVVWLTSTNVNPIGRSIRQFASGFGAVTVLYPHSQLEGFADFLNRTVYDFVDGKYQQFAPKDLLIDVYEKKNGLDEYLIEPSIVQHTGRHSSLYARDLSALGYSNMYRSFSYPDYLKTIQFDPTYVFSTNS